MSISLNPTKAMAKSLASPTTPAALVAANTVGNEKNANTTSSVTANGTDKPGVVLQGYLKKLKTMKKKYFVLLNDNSDKPARLEYYDSEKKFRTRFGHPKRSIILKSCFHISRRLDTKQKFVIALYTKDDSFCLVLETENDLNKWLKALLALHRIDDAEVDAPRTNFGKLNFSVNALSLVLVRSFSMSMSMFIHFNERRNQNKKIAKKKKKRNKNTKILILFDTLQSTCGRFK